VFDNIGKESNYIKKLGTMHHSRYCFFCSAACGLLGGDRKKNLPGKSDKLFLLIIILKKWAIV
jgi:hypothetical protein